MASPKSRSTSAKVFTLFPGLPSELRIKIWQHACYPRTLRLTYSSASSSFICTSSPPVLLSINRESRHEAHRIYTLSFGTFSSPPRTYFNPYLDTLYLPRSREMGYDDTLRDFRDLVHDPERLLDQVRCIAIDHVNVESKRPWESYNTATLLRGFKKLDRVLLILNADGSGAGDGYGEVQESRSKGIEEAGFQDLRIDPEVLLRTWYCFRMGIMMEEKVLEEIARNGECEYEPFTLPTVRLKAKVIQNSREVAAIGGAFGSGLQNNIPPGITI